MKMMPKKSITTTSTSADRTLGRGQQAAPDTLRLCARRIVHMQQFASHPQHFMVIIGREDETELKMNRMSQTPASTKSINPADLYYIDASKPKPAKPQPQLSPLDLMYAYYDAT
jgi:hypothetical protein